MKPIYFVHIPKTAGTSFREAALKYYGKRSIVCDYGDSEPQTSDIVQKYAYDNRDYWKVIQKTKEDGSSMLAGHVSILKYIAGMGSTNTVVFFRDPLQRMYSEYQHLVRHKRFKASFSDLFTRTPLVNLLSKKLTGMPLEAIGFFGLTESYAESLDLFNYIFDSNVKELKENKGRKGLAEKHQIDLNDVQAFNELNTQDIELYQYAKDLFVQRLELYRKKVPFAHAKLVTTTKDKVSGWAWWERDNDDPVTVLVRINGDIVDRVVSTELKPNILRIGPPRCGYVGFSCPIAAKPGDSVDCVVEKTGQLFPLSPVIVT